MTQLEPCPHCHRHVKVSETTCPFCARSLADAFANVAPRVGPRARLGRAATFAFGVVAATQGACTDDDGSRAPQDAASTPSDGTHQDAAIDAPDYDGGGVPIYAAAPTSNGSDSDTTSRG